MERILKKTCQGYLLQVRSKVATITEEPSLALAPLLSEFSDILVDPVGIPPRRSHDHQIPFLPGSAPTNVQPYCYTHFHKTENERIVQEMRDASIIRPSFSPYSFPVLLMHKKDGTWRMCVDYQALNNNTVKISISSL